MAYITPLVINALGADTETNTHTYRHVKKNDFKKLGAHGQRSHAPGLIKSSQMTISISYTCVFVPKFNNITMKPQL